MCCAAGNLAVLDPEVLAWLQDPQLVQDSKDVQSVYTLQEQFSRLGQKQVKACDILGARGGLETVKQAIFLGPRQTNLLYSLS